MVEENELGSNYSQSKWPGNGRFWALTLKVRSPLGGGVPRMKVPDVVTRSIEELHGKGHAEASVVGRVIPKGERWVEVGS